MARVGSGQNPRHAPKIPHSGDRTLGAELVLWTPTQQPKPLSALVPPENPVPSTGQKLEIVSPEDGAIRSSESEALVGEVVKTGDNYALATAESETYILESQHELRTYQGEVVKIVGQPNPVRNLIHVLSIEPVSVNRMPKE
jgi:hypothetical protein